LVDGSRRRVALEVVNDLDGSANIVEIELKPPSHVVRGPAGVLKHGEKPLKLLKAGVSCTFAVLDDEQRRLP
jgi:hypothetical protein